MAVSREMAYRGERFCVQSRGSGPPIVLLRGFDVAFRNDSFLDELSHRYEVIVPDHPGFGGSNSPGWLKGWRIPPISTSICSPLLATISPVHLIGASLGGWLAAEIAIRDAANIRSLILIGPAGVRKENAAIGDPFIRSPEQSAIAMFGNGTLARELRCPVETDDEIDLHLKNSIGLARLGWQPRLASPELQRWLHRIRVPTCLIWGSVDRIMPLEHSKAWLDALADARLSVIEGAGHLPHIEAPQKTAAAVASFIQECQ